MGWWIWGMRNTSEYTMERMNLPAVIVISMASNHFGHMLNEGSQNSMVSPNIRFICTSRNVSSDLITEMKISMIEY